MFFFLSMLLMKFYSNKVLTLMILELFFVFCICSVLLYNHMALNSFMVCFLLCLMMVVDSVFGISSLIKLSRYESTSCKTLAL